MPFRICDFDNPGVSIRDVISTAEEDIIVYKALRYRSDMDIYTTPFRNVCVPDDVIAGNSSMKPLYNVNYDMITRNVGKGFLHSFANEYGARRLQKVLRRGTMDVFKCIIPKGTEFIKGDFCGDKSYASRELKFIERL